MPSDSAIVRALADSIHKTKKRGPAFMRRPGWKASPLPMGRGGVGGGSNTFTWQHVQSAFGLRWWEGNGYSKKAAKRLFRRAVKKAAQPHRTNHQRGSMRSKAAGKREVTRHG